MVGTVSLASLPGDGQTMDKRWANANGNRFSEAPDLTLVR
jgi:hypothetical protein